MADYLRQRAVHLKQSAYSVRLTKGGEVLDERSINHLAKTFSIDDVDWMRAAVQDRHGSGERFARHIAVKVRPGAQRLVLGLRELRALR